MGCTVSPSKRLVYLWLACVLLRVVRGDIYLHNPRGSNNKLDEANNGRQNANRLFDSQNNGNGGYNVGSLYYYAGSTLRVEWTNQHGCGGDAGADRNVHTHCELVLQYACEDTMPGARDGSVTARIPADADGAARIEYGQHETLEYYDKCARRERNRGLFVADQNLKGSSARYTRQNPNGTRYGLECAEERDYYPYWQPTPWKDIAVLTSDTSRCAMYVAESENVKGRSECTDSQFNNASECTASGAQWVQRAPHGVAAPACEAAPWTRDNHLGDVPDVRGFAHYDWKIPEDFHESCILRIRYNITTGDYNAWDGTAVAGTSESLVVADYPRGSGAHTLRDFPRVDFGIGAELELAVNTAQYGRVFQDRSHTFAIRQRPESVAPDAEVFNINVRGRRGNIVQVYPSVEYDFVPGDLAVERGTYAHWQWTGSNTNPNGNDGQGRQGTDRSNVVLLDSLKKNYPVHALTRRALPRQTGYAEVAIPAPLAATCAAGRTRSLLASEPVGQLNTPQLGGETSELDDAGTYFDGGLVRLTESGVINYGSTRNNNFSNRAQKARLTVRPPQPVSYLSTIIFTSALAAAGAIAIIIVHAKRNPTSKIARLWHNQTATRRDSTVTREHAQI